MGFDTEFKDEIKSGFIKQIADKILQQLIDVNAHSEVASRRWIWELLQNAKDVPNKWGKVSVEIRLTQDELVFSHNADPFSVRNITNLIQQVSSKYAETRDSDTTGQFGTGFISTHALSRIIHIEGVVKDKNGHTKKFNFTLDRSAEEPVGMMAKIESSLAQLETLSDNLRFPIDFYDLTRTERTFSTRFHYPLSGKSLDYARLGLADLDATLPLVLCFVPKIKSVKVDDQVAGESYEYDMLEPEFPDGITVNRIRRKSANNSEPRLINVAVASNDGVSVALQLEKKEGEYFVMERPDDAPVLFKEFPLIGTHEFFFPAYIQSNNFHPATDRDGIYLSASDQDNVKTNRLELTKALGLIIGFFKPSSVSMLENRHLLAVSRIPVDTKEYLSKEWYKSEIQIPLRKAIIDSPLVKVRSLATTEYKTIRDCRFPYYSDDAEKNLRFWQLCSNVSELNIPVRECYQQWLDVITPDYDTWSAELKFRIQDLMQLVSSKINLESLSACLSGMDAVSWLNQLIGFILDEDRRSLLDTNGIIPNQLGVFNKLEHLYFDNNLPPELLDIYKILRSDIRAKLVHKSIMAIPNNSEYAVKDISSMINAVITDYNSYPENAPDNIRQGLFKLAAYITSEDSTIRKSIYRFAYSFYPSLTPSSYTLLPGTSDFNWEPLNKWIVRMTLRRIVWARSISVLETELNISSQAAVDLLRDLYMFVNSYDDFKVNLSNYQCIPNQYGDFCMSSSLSDDIDCIPDNLKTILYNLNNGEDWKSLLVYNNIGYTVGRQKTFSEICNKIDDIIKQRSQNDSLDDEKVKAPVLAVLQLISESGNQFDSLFKWTYEHRPGLMMHFIENSSFKEGLFRIMQNKDLVSNIETLSSLGVTADEMKNIAEAISVLGVDKVLEAMEVLVEEKRDFEFKKNIGEYAEMAFIQSIREASLPIEVIHTDGSYDFYLVINSKDNYKIELKSCSVDSPYVLMHKSQADEASRHPDAFALCVIERSMLQPTKEYFAAHSRFVIDIGQRVGSAVNKGNEIETIIMDEIHDVGLFFDNPKFKYKIKSSVWSGALSFVEFLEHLKNKFQFNK